MKFVALKYLTDEDFDNRVVRGLLLRDPELDIVRVQDVGLGGSTDPENLAFAASQGRILLTHDVSTISGFVKERLEAGERVPGIIEVPQAAPIGTVIEDLLLLAKSSQPNEWEGQTSPRHSSGSRAPHRSPGVIRNEKTSIGCA